MLELQITKRTDTRLLELMTIHYSQPKGFVGRNICYAIFYNKVYYGHIIGGSATKFLPGRNQYFNITSKQLNSIINNIFYHIHKIGNKYPFRNFTSYILNQFTKQIKQDWADKYNNEVLGFESLVELPRTGDLYKKDNWDLVGQTLGYTCKRVAGKGTDSWSGKRVWDTDNLRPKLVFCKKVA